MAVYVIREEEDPLQPPQDIGIVIEGVEVLNKLPSLALGCAVLLGLIKALNLSYPSELKHTFDALQKMFMETDPKKMTVCSLSQALNTGLIKDRHLDTACFCSVFTACTRYFPG